MTELAETLATKVLWTAVVIAFVWITIHALVLWISFRRLRGPERFLMHILSATTTVFLVVSPATFGLSIKHQIKDATNAVDVTLTTGSLVEVEIVAAATVWCLLGILAYKFRHMRMQIVQPYLEKWATLSEEQRKSFDELF